MHIATVPVYVSVVMRLERTVKLSVCDYVTAYRFGGIDYLLPILILVYLHNEIKFHSKYMFTIVTMNSLSLAKYYLIYIPKRLCS